MNAKTARRTAEKQNTNLEGEARRRLDESDRADEANWFPAAKLKHILTELAKLLYRLNSDSGSNAEFQRRAEIVRLATHLARLDGAKPEDMLARAVLLHTNAGAAMAAEQLRPEREASEAIRTRMQEIVDIACVRPEAIYSPGKREAGDLVEVQTHTIGEGPSAFQWTTYRSAKGFRELLTAHYGHICDDAESELSRVVSTKPKDAKSFCDARGLFFDNECALRVAQVRTTKEKAEFLSFWKARAVSKTAERVAVEAKAGMLDEATLRALAQTRSRLHTRRAEKAAAAKSIKAAATGKPA